MTTVDQGVVMSTSAGVIGTAVVGAGYWGPNLVRNISASTACDLRWVCDLDLARAQRAVGRYSTIGVTDDIDDVLARDT